MDKFIVVSINLFTAEQLILMYSEAKGISKEIARVELAKLPEVVVSLAVGQKISDIKLVGNYNYATAIEQEIQTYAIKEYGKNELNIEIMEG